MRIHRSLTGIAEQLEIGGGGGGAPLVTQYWGGGAQDTFFLPTLHIPAPRPLFDK